MRENDCLQSSFTAYLCGTAEVIIIDLFYCLEVDHTLQLGLMFVCGRENNVGLFKRLKNIDNNRLFLARKATAHHIHAT